MCHVCLHQMPRSQCATETELSGQHRRAHDPRQSSRIVAWVGRVRSSHAEEVEHRRLRFQDRATTKRADFDGWHGHTDLQVAVYTASGQRTDRRPIIAQTYFFMIVIQLLLSTTCAGSCPVAKKSAVTMFDA